MSCHAPPASADRMISLSCSWIVTRSTNRGASVQPARGATPQSLVFAETIRDQCRDRLQRLDFVRAIGAEYHLCALRRGEEHHAHDALAIDSPIADTDPDRARERFRDVDEFRRSARVQTEAIDDRDVAFEHSAVVLKPRLELTMTNEHVRHLRPEV